jgi:uncharacterized protein (TIGR02284 family)
MGNQDITTINTLIATTIDSANGFEEAARTANATGLSMQFAELARDRWEIVEKLEDEVRRMGSEPKRSGTAKAAMHRRWLDLRNAVAGSDRAVLQEVQNGETYLCSKYEAALGSTGMSTEARRCIEDALASVRRDQERVRGLSMTVGSSAQAGRLNTDWRRLGSTLGMAAAFGTAAFVATRMMRSGGQPATGQRWRRGRTLTIDRTDRAEIEARNAEAVPTSGRNAAAAASEMPGDMGSDASGARSTKRSAGRRGARTGDTGTAGMTAGGSAGMGSGLQASTGPAGSPGSSPTAMPGSDTSGTGFQSSGGAADLSTGGGTGMSPGGSDDTSSGAGNTGSFGSTGGSGSFGR